MSQPIPREQSRTTIANVAMPNNLEAERAVLGAMLLNNEIVDDVLHEVRRDDFYHPPHAAIFQAIVELHANRRPIELTVLADELRRMGKLDDAGGYLYLASLEQHVLTTGAAPELARVVAEKAMLRKLMLAADTILREASEEKTSATDALDRAEKAIFEIGRNTQANTFHSTATLMPEEIEEIGKLMSNRGALPGQPTHFPDLDKFLNGLQPSDLLILAARPSIGKTAFALNVAMNIALKDGVPVAIFSLEMGAKQLNMRLLASQARVSAGLTRRGLVTDQQFERLRQTAAQMAQAPIFIDETAAISIVQLRARARRLKAQHEALGLIVVDYLQLMTGPDTRSGREANRQQEVSEISRGLKALARELNVPVIALSQLSRNIEQRGTKKEAARPMLSDLRESGSIEQDADVVMFVHRERLEAEKDEQGNPMYKNLPIPTELIIGKHRNGPTGVVNLVFFSDYTLFASAKPEPKS